MAVITCSRRTVPRGGSKGENLDLPKKHTRFSKPAARADRFPTPKMQSAESCIRNKWPPRRRQTLLGQAGKTSKNKANWNAKNSARNLMFVKLLFSLDEQMGYSELEGVAMSFVDASWLRRRGQTSSTVTK